MGIGADPHTDGMQDLGHSEDWTLRCSRIDAVPHPNYLHDVTSALLIKTDFGPIDNVTLEGNYFNGGAYTVYSVGRGTGYPAPTNVTIRNNAFGRDYAFGVTDVSESNPVWINNYWADTNQQIDQYGDPTGATREQAP